VELSKLNFLFEIIVPYKDLIIWLGLISMVIFFFSLLSIKWLVGMIPEDYFIRNGASKTKSNNPVLWYFVLIFKNLFGYTLIFGGIMMLILPGQGLFTIIIGLLLSNYPGKYKIEKKVIAIPSVLRSINWLRKKTNKPPIKIT
tara:strand:- start:285 stop:713 length:429 start_codon:yes stop_codon:yes gene_type:complete